jgi:hypothetical protein
MKRIAKFPDNLPLEKELDNFVKEFNGLPSPPKVTENESTVHPPEPKNGDWHKIKSTSKLYIYINGWILLN